MAHHTIETIDGTPAYRVDVGGHWKHFRTAVCVDYGGNIYESRTAPASTCGLGAAGPLGIPCRVSYCDEIEAESTDHGTLYSLRTGEEIRPATAEEEAESRAAGDSGAIQVEIDGEPMICFVQ